MDAPSNRSRTFGLEISQQTGKEASPTVSEEGTPGETGAVRAARSRFLPVAGLVLTSGGLGISVLLATLAGFQLISVPWNTVALPRIALFGLLPLSLVGLAVSTVSCIYNRDAISIIGIGLGVLATLASLLAWLLIIAAAMAGHPV